MIFRFPFLFLFTLAAAVFPEHVIPPEKYGPPYWYSADPALRLYHLPLAAGETTFVSDGWRTDPGGVVGDDHPDFAVDLDVKGPGRWAACARSGRVMQIDNAPGGETNFCTVWIGRVDSIPDSTVAGGWRKGQTRDMYRHIVTGFDLKLGDYVEQGQNIARVIYAPLSSFTHLHFQVDFYLGGVKTTLPPAFMEIDGPGRSEGFPEVGDTYVSRNVPVKIDGFQLKVPVTNNSISMNLFPNPFTASASINFSLPAQVHSANLEIYDATGRRTQSLLTGVALNPGNYAVLWQAGWQARGVFFIRLKADGLTIAKQVIKY